VRGTLEVLYDYGALSRKLSPLSFAQTRRFSLWRYEEVLPVGFEYAVDLRAGWTPLYARPELAAELGLAGLWIKDDSLNPTGSYKDRATAVVIAAARYLSRSALTCASTGNTASSVAGFCAAAGIPAYIFVPERTPRPKVAQLLAFGATVFAVEGDYSHAQKLCEEARDRFGWYDRSDGVSPINAEGKKTGAYEIWEQLGGKVPDCVLVSVGDGSVISGICKGFFELRELGLAETVPKVFGVQAQGAAAVAYAFARHKRGEEILPAEGPAETFADSICVGNPKDVVKAVTYVDRTGGGFVTVSDEEILGAVGELARKVGVFAEPAAAASYAGLLALLRVGAIPEGAKVTLVITGSGLKDPEGALRAAGEPLRVPPEIGWVERILSENTL
jgi:threonine synthase